MPMRAPETEAISSLTTSGSSSGLIPAARSPKYWRLEYRRPAKETLRAIGACPETSRAEVVAAAGEARKPIEASTSLSGCS